MQSEVVREPETETESRSEGDPLEDCEGEVESDTTEGVERCRVPVSE